MTWNKHIYGIPDYWNVFRSRISWEMDCSHSSTFNIFFTAAEGDWQLVVTPDSISSPKCYCKCNPTCQIAPTLVNELSMYWMFNPRRRCVWLAPGLITLCLIRKQQCILFSWAPRKQSAFLTFLWWEQTWIQHRPTFQWWRHLLLCCLDPVARPRTDEMISCNINFYIFTWFHIWLSITTLKKHHPGTTSIFFFGHFDCEYK